jgi:hypothetical protein
MKVKSVLYGILVGGLLTAPLIGVMALGDQLLELPFPPYDLFNWMSRLLPGPVITFGIDMMIDMLLLLGFDVADTAKIAEQGMAIGLFFAIGAVSGGIFFWILASRRVKADLFSGLVIGAVFGLPIVVISIALGNPPAFSALPGLGRAGVPVLPAHFPRGGRSDRHGGRSYQRTGGQPASVLDLPGGQRGGDHRGWGRTGCTALSSP